MRGTVDSTFAAPSSHATTSPWATAGGTATTRPFREWSWRTTQPSGTARPCSASRARAPGPDPCWRPIGGGSARPLRASPGVHVASGTSAPRPDMRPNRPLLGSGTSSTRTAGSKLIHPRWAATMAAMRSTTAAGSSGVNST